MAVNVKEMYHMFRLPDCDKPIDCDKPPEEEPSVYPFEITVLGQVSAPSRANYTMWRNAHENGKDPPSGVKAVYKHFFMGDGLPSANSREQAIDMGGGGGGERFCLYK